MVAVGCVALMLFQPVNGPINQVLRLLGVAEDNLPKWFMSSKTALLTVVIVVVWKQAGYYMIMFIGGLKAIPAHLYEAAKMDGANSWQRLWKVTIPMMMPSITICTFLSITNGFKLFDQNLSLTAGEPSKLSEMMALNIYNTFYGRSGWEGVGQAKAVIFFVIVVAIGLIQLRATRSKEVQQ